MVTDTLKLIDLVFKAIDLLLFPFVVLTLIVFLVMLLGGRISIRKIREKDCWWARWFV